jgi:3-phosphoshikimate 1-carboxyvinyltransferase
MLAPLAAGTSHISGLASGADVAATAAAMRSLGVEPRVGIDGSWEIEGVARLKSCAEPIDCGNSGTTARLLTGLIAGSGITVSLDGDDSLRRRPMARVVEPLRKAGARVDETGEAGRLPLGIAPGQLTEIDHELEVASAQVKSALLLAGLAAGVPVRLFEPGRSRDHTERMLRAMGVAVESASVGPGRTVRLAPGASSLLPLSLTVPGDISSAAYWIALAVLGGCGDGVRVEGVGLNPGRTGFLRALEAMGARVSMENVREVAGEPVGDIWVEPSEVMGIALPEEWVPTLLDEVPILACVAAGARGTTTIRGVGELRVKESDRIAALCGNLSVLGVTCVEHEDGLEIKGAALPVSGGVKVEGDHRIAMAFGVLGALPGSQVQIDDPACVSVSYPEFWDQLTTIERATTER